MQGSASNRESGRKREDCSQLPSVKEILLVSSEGRCIRYPRCGDLIGETELRLETIP